MSVIVPIDVPLSITFAPMSGLPVSSEIVPFIVNLPCAKSPA